MLSSESQTRPDELSPWSVWSWAPLAGAAQNVHLHFPQKSHLEYFQAGRPFVDTAARRLEDAAVSGVATQPAPKPLCEAARTRLTADCGRWIDWPGAILMAEGFEARQQQHPDCRTIPQTSLPSMTRKEDRHTMQNILLEGNTLLVDAISLAQENVT